MTDVLRLDDQFAIVAEARGLAGAQRVLKYGDTFGVFDSHGDAVLADTGEQGLYFHGTRFLSHFELHFAHGRPMLLSSTVSDDNVAFVADFTNPDVRRNNRLELPRGEIHLFRSRVLGDGFSVDRVRLSNHSTRIIDVPLWFSFGADFADIFEVRGTQRLRRGSLLPVQIGDGAVLSYIGLDNVERRTILRWTRTPDTVDEGVARFLIRLAPREAVSFDLTVACEEDATERVVTDYESALNHLRAVHLARAQTSTLLPSSNEAMNLWVKRSTADLQMMITDTPSGLYPYAGIPWFSTPFGRDGLITAYELLWANPQVARGVLSFLAATQATERSEAQDAEPGKILHEMRSGEMPALGEVPFGRYYGSIDSTPLFVMLAHAYFRRSGDAAFIDAIWPNLLAALRWMERYGDADGDGFLEYARHSENGLVQQGWKDSYDSVFHADGVLAEAPIALCEVQGYAYAAWRGAAELAESRCDGRAAAEWGSRGDRLRGRFEELFWSEELGTYALALDRHKRPCLVRTSNAAHCLFTGIVESYDRARRTFATLMGDASFAGWGIRTVAAGEARYNPMSYHNGSIWPHDNAIAAAGFARYGFNPGATRILDAMLDLSQAVDLHRLPELLCGFHRRTHERPTLYPVACSPQAWSAGAVYLIVQAALGLDIDAGRRRITFTKAALPESVDRIHLTNLTVGDSRVHLLLERHGDDVAVRVLKREGQIEVVTIR